MHFCPFELAVDVSVAVQAIAEMGSLPVPTLALNTLDDYQSVSTYNFYQFGLSPRDEAVQAADCGVVSILMAPRAQPLCEAVWGFCGPLSQVGKL